MRKLGGIGAATALGLGALVASGAARADGIPIGGQIFSDAYVPTRDFDHRGFNQLSTSLWLESNPKLNDQASAHFTLQADALEANVSASGTRTVVREAYISYLPGGGATGWEIRVGRQIIPWGKADGVNPTDFLSAEDYTFLNPDAEMKRVPATSLHVSWTPEQGNSPFTFHFIWQPVFPQSTLLINPVLIPSNVSLGGVRSPTPTFANSEEAFKVSYVAPSWDISLLAFRGWNHMPEFEETSVTLIPGGADVGIAPTFHTIRAAGGDASVAAGSWILRAESAYVWTENNDGTNTLIQPSHWDTVVGAERPMGDFRLEGQFIWRYIPRFTDPSAITGPDAVSTQIDQSIARMNATLLNYQDQSRPAASFRLGYNDEGTGLDASVFVLGNLVGGDSLIRPKVSYAWNDAVRTTFGVDHYVGPDDRPLGLLKFVNSVFAEAKYSF